MALLLLLGASQTDLGDPVQDVGALRRERHRRRLHGAGCHVLYTYPLLEKPTPVVVSAFRVPLVRWRRPI